MAAPWRLSTKRGQPRATRTRRAPTNRVGLSSETAAQSARPVTCNSWPRLDHAHGAGADRLAAGDQRREALHMPAAIGHAPGIGLEHPDGHQVGRLRIIEMVEAQQPGERAQPARAGWMPAFRRGYIGAEPLRQARAGIAGGESCGRVSAALWACRWFWHSASNVAFAVSIVVGYWMTEAVDGMVLYSFCG